MTTAAAPVPWVQDWPGRNPLLSMLVDHGLVSVGFSLNLAIGYQKAPKFCQEQLNIVCSEKARDKIMKERTVVPSV